MAYIVYIFDIDNIRMIITTLIAHTHTHCTKNLFQFDQENEKLMPHFEFIFIYVVPKKKKKN